MPVDPSLLGKTIAAIESKYGQDAIAKGSDEPSVSRISTGSLGLDWATGGGIPRGRISRFWGGYSSGKSLTCWNLIREAQKMGLICAYYNIEKQFDPDYARARGVNVEDLYLVQGTRIEETGAKLEALLGSIHVHVVDSTSSAISVDELNANVEDWQMGLAARVWGKVLRRVEERMDQNENTIVLISQARDMFGSYSGGEEPPGGRAMEHTSSLTLHFRRSSWLFLDQNGYLKDEQSTGSKTLSGLAEADGAAYTVRVTKSRVCRPLRQAVMWYDFAKKEFDLTEEYLRVAKLFGMLSSSGGWWKWQGEETGQREKQARERVESDPDLRERIEDALYGRLEEERERGIANAVA